METATRPLTIDEMYFKKATKLHLTAETISGSTNNNFMEPGGRVTPIELKPNIPELDLSNKVFGEPCLREKAGVFFKENWGWLLLGASIITCIVIHENNKKKKKQNQLPIHPPYST